MGCFEPTLVSGIYTLKQYNILNTPSSKIEHLVANLIP